MSNSLITQSYILRSLAQQFQHLSPDQQERYKLIGKVYNQICQFLNNTFETRNKEIIIAEIPFLGKFQLEQQKEVTFFPSSLLAEEVQFKNPLMNEEQMKPGYRQELNLSKLSDQSGLKKEEVKNILFSFVQQIITCVKKNLQVVLDFKLNLALIVIINSNQVEVTEKSKLTDYITQNMRDLSKFSRLSSQMSDRSQNRFQKNFYSQTRKNKSMGKRELMSGFSSYRKKSKHSSVFDANPDEVIQMAQDQKNAFVSKVLPSIPRREQPLGSERRKVHSSLYQSQIERDSISSLIFKNRRKSSIEDLKQKQIELEKQKEQLHQYAKETFVIQKFNKERQKELRESLLQQVHEKQKLREMEKEEENRFEVHFPFHLKPKYDNAMKQALNSTAPSVNKEVPDQFANHAPQVAYRLLKDPLAIETKDSAADRLNQTMGKLINEKLKQKNEFNEQIQNFQKEQDMRKQCQKQMQENQKKSLQKQMKEEQMRKKLEKDFMYNQDSGYEWMDKYKIPEQAFNNFGPDESPSRVLVQMNKKQDLRNQFRDNLLSQIKENAQLKKKQQDDELNSGSKIVDMANFMNKTSMQNDKNKTKMQKDTLRDIWNKQKMERQKYEEVERIFQ